MIGGPVNGGPVTGRNPIAILRRVISPAGLALPAGILIIVGLMIVPVPAIALDVFFVFNIALSIAILMTAMNAEKPLDFSAFPSVLLFATLLRLALNVASTRVVLVHGHEGGAAAGHVIEAFGAFLIGGNFIVGLFVFMILMIINLVVVTKGAGRVSEVSARFTLDALPGKQMAIDADLAAGLLTAEEAKARRREVATEADFYGAMDGSSKFVKGDAIAALLVLAVNVIAGFCLGMISHGMSAGEAAERYITLAVGDALVAQVPALLLSIAAAAIVTRVADPRGLAGQIGMQFAGPGTWLPVALILGAFGLIPAMPQLIFLPAAAISGFVWWKLRARADRAANYVAPVAPVDPGRIAVSEVSDHTMVTIELGYGLVHLVDEARGAPLASRVTGVRRQLSQSLGFVLPPFRVRDALELPPYDYRIVLGGVPLGGALLRPDRLLAIDSGEVGPDHGLIGEPARDPSCGCAALWIEPAQRDHAVAMGFLVVDPATIIATQLGQLIGERGHLLLGADEVRSLLESLKDRNAALVETLTPQPLSLAALTRLLRAALAEGISLAHPLPLFASLAEAVQQTLDHDRLIDLLRADLGSSLIAAACKHDAALAVVTLDAALEATIVQGMVDPLTGQPAIEPGLAREIDARIAALIDARGLDESGGGAIALIVQPRARRALAALLRPRGAHCLVLSIAELPATQRIEVIDTIGAPQSPLAAPPLQEPQHMELAA